MNHAKQLPTHEVYADQLLSLKLGYALYEPDPGEGHDEVHIGDVGYIFHGRFKRFTNVFSCGPDYPSIEDEFHEIEVFADLDDGIMSSEHVQSRRFEIEVGGREVLSGTSAGICVRISCTSECGASLVTKYRAKVERSSFPDVLKEHFMKFNNSWLADAQRQRKPIKHLHDLILVTGRVMTGDWATIAFCGQSREHSVSFDMQALTVTASGTVWGRWSEHVNQPKRHGPSRQIPIVDGLEPPLNQCIFIETFRVFERSWYSRLKAAISLKGNVGSIVKKFLVRQGTVPSSGKSQDTPVGDLHRAGESEVSDSDVPDVLTVYESLAFCAFESVGPEVDLICIDEEDIKRLSSESGTSLVSILDIGNHSYDGHVKVLHTNTYLGVGHGSKGKEKLEPRTCGILDPVPLISLATPSPSKPSFPGVSMISALRLVPPIYRMRSYSSTLLSRKSDGDKDNEPVKVIRTGRGGWGNIRKQKPKARALGLQNFASPMSFTSSSTASSSTTQSSFSSLATPSDRSSIISISARNNDTSSPKAFRAAAISTSDGSDMEDAPRHTSADPPSTLLSVVPRSVHSLILRIPSSSGSRSVSPHPSDSPVERDYPQPYEDLPNEGIPEIEYASTLGRDCSAVFQGPQTRIGRGGPGSFKKIISALEPGSYKGPMHPSTSAIVEEEENKRVILERNLLEHSLAQGMLLYSSGRSGTGNIMDQRKLENQQRSHIAIERKKNRDSTISTSSKLDTRSTSNDDTASASSLSMHSKLASRRSSNFTRPLPSSTEEGPVTRNIAGGSERRGIKRLFRRAKAQKRVDSKITSQEESSKGVTPFSSSESFTNNHEMSKYAGQREVFEVSIEGEEKRESPATDGEHSMDLFADDEDENDSDEDANTPNVELSDSEFLDIVLSAFPTDFSCNNEESVIGHDLNVRQRFRALSMQEAKREVQLLHSRTRTKSLSGLISNPTQNVTLQDLRRPLPSIPVEWVSQHH